MSMNVNQILQTIHRIYEGSTDYPTSSEEDYIFRLGLVNDAIREWGENSNAKWRELYKTTSGTLSSTILSCPSDFDSIASLLNINGSLYQYVKNDEVMALQNSSSKFFYITGSPGSYIININPTPSIGDSYSYSYYSTPTLMTSGNDIPQMSKPMFIVYWVLARLYEQDGEISKMSFYEQKAVDKLSEMILDNEAPPYNNEYRIIDDDVGYKLRGDNFGL